MSTGAVLVGLPAYRRRIARVALSVASLVAIAMLLALPLDVWTFSGSRGERWSFAVLLSTIVLAVAAHVGISRRRRYGSVLAIALGIYAVSRLVEAAVMSRVLPGGTAADARWSLAVVSMMYAALIIAAWACVAEARRGPAG